MKNKNQKNLIATVTNEQTTYIHRLLTYNISFALRSRIKITKDFMLSEHLKISRKIPYGGKRSIKANCVVSLCHPTFESPHDSTYNSDLRVPHTLVKSKIDPPEFARLWKSNFGKNEAGTVGNSGVRPRMILMDIINLIGRGAVGYRIHVFNIIYTRFGSMGGLS